jgi:hypothetical protein
LFAFDYYPPPTLLLFPYKFLGSAELLAGFGLNAGKVEALLDFERLF